MTPRNRASVPVALTASARNLPPSEVNAIDRHERPLPLRDSGHATGRWAQSIDAVERFIEACFSGVNDFG